MTKQYEDEHLDSPPPSQTVFVEGLPGVGKTFLIRTLRNITKIITNRNDSVMASAPTGCAASMIDGSTHNRQLGVPCGKSLAKAPSNMKVSNAMDARARITAMRNCYTYLEDEHSMKGRPQWGWVEHRQAELRRDKPVLDNAGNELVLEESSDDNPLPPMPKVPEEIASRPHGGIPYLLSSGDTNQLPAVGMKSLYDTSPGRTGSADALGKIVLSNFIDSPHPNEVQSTVVIMDEVIRQRDQRYLTFLDHMRNGTIDDDDMNTFIFDKCKDQLRPEEQAQFDDALHLVPQWKMANDIVFHYLQNIMTDPLALMRAKTHMCKKSGKNCVVKDLNVPLIMALCVGYKVMLLTSHKRYCRERYYEWICWGWETHLL